LSEPFAIFRISRRRRHEHTKVGGIEKVCIRPAAAIYKRKDVFPKYTTFPCDKENIPLHVLKHGLLGFNDAIYKKQKARLAFRRFSWLKE
jgi:hypothetical protein